MNLRRAMSQSHNLEECNSRATFRSGDQMEGIVANPGQQNDETVPSAGLCPIDLCIRQKCKRGTIILKTGTQDSIQIYTMFHPHSMFRNERQTVSRLGFQAIIRPIYSTNNKRRNTVYNLLKAQQIITTSRVHRAAPAGSIQHTSFKVKTNHNEERNEKTRA